MAGGGGCGGVGGHSVLGAIAAAGEVFDRATDRPLWVLDAAGTRRALADLAALVSRVAELEARLLSHAETVEAYAEPGATSTANGLAHATRVTRREAHGKTGLAAALEQHPLTREALARGEVRVEQARVICRAWMS